MIKRVVIAGCRDYNNYAEAKAYIDFCLSDIRKENNIIIVSGCASGADAIGERYAEENGFKVEKYPPNWEKYGRSAGPRRNKQMAEVSDYVICFWDKKSKGTKSMIEFAQKCGKIVKIKTILKDLKVETLNA
jgi:predicted Rossmann fold nucleotide-binding protein DprA/Smf involved in DNA uptake